MKRSPLKRKTPLRARRPATRKSGRVRDPGYMQRVRGLRCCAFTLWPWAICDGSVEAHHAGARAAGRKADDDTCIPLCTGHHRQWHAASGVFSGLTRESRSMWASERIADTRRALGVA